MGVLLKMPSTDKYAANRKSIQGSLPIDHISPDGMGEKLLAGRKKDRKVMYSKTFRIIDMNYAAEDVEQQEELLITWQDVLKWFDNTATVQITVFRHSLTEKQVHELTQIPLVGDADDELRKLVNEILLEKFRSGYDNRRITEQFLTVSIVRRTREEAERYFLRAETELRVTLSGMKSNLLPLGREERLRLFSNIYRSEEWDGFNFSEEKLRQKQMSVKEFFAPDRFEPKDDYIVLSERRLARALVVRDYPMCMSDSILRELTQTDGDVLVTLTLAPIEKNDAISKCDTVSLSIEKNIEDRNRKHRNIGDFMTEGSPQLNRKREDVLELLSDLQDRDQSLFFMTVTLVHFAEDKDALDVDTEKATAAAKQRQLVLKKNMFVQEDTFNHCLPYGLRLVDDWTYQKSESVSAFNPFTALEIRNRGGIYYGDNAITGHGIFGDTRRLLNGHCIVLGKPGSGKSFWIKLDLVQRFLRYRTADIIVVDPDREFVKLCRLLRGQRIVISSASEDHINPLEIARDLNAGMIDQQDRPQRVKTEFMVSLTDQLFDRGGKGLSQQERSVVERALRRMYERFHSDESGQPTMRDFYEELKNQPEQEARDIALGLEMYVAGSMDAFAYDTNVNLENRMTVYDICDLGEGLRDVGMSVMLDHIYYRVLKNRQIGRATIIYMDEFHVMLGHEKSAKFLQTMWKRYRKYGAYSTAITQHVSDMTGNSVGNKMLTESDMVVMFAQSQGTAVELQNILGFPDSQIQYLLANRQGQGLIMYGKEFVPFKNKFPEGNMLYDAMDTTSKDRRGVI